MTEQNEKLGRLRAIMTGDDNIGMWGTHDAAPHQAVMTYTTHHPPEAIFSDNYFLSCRSCFMKGTVKPGENPYRAGDEVRVMCYLDDGTWAKCLIEVAYIDENRIVVEQVTPWRYGGQSPDLKLADATHIGGGRWKLFYSDGKAYRGGQLVTKTEAERLLGRPVGRQSEEQAA